MANYAVVRQIYDNDGDDDFDDDIDDDDDWWRRKLSKQRTRRCDRFEPKIVEVWANLAIFWSFEGFGRLPKMKQYEDEYVKQTIEEDKDKKMKMSNKPVEEEDPRPMDFAT